MAIRSFIVAFPPGPAGTNRWSVTSNRSFRGFFNRNIPQECHDKMLQFFNAGHKIQIVAFPPGPAGTNRWSVVTDRSFFNRNIPQECHDKMLQFFNAGHKIQIVAFPPGPAGTNRWSVVTDKAYFNRNIPQECHDKVQFFFGGSVTVHLKILENPNISVDQMINNMRQVYSTANMDVTIGSTENLNLPLLTDLDIGTCTRGNTTSEQNELFDHRNNVEGNDIAVYFIRSTIPPTNGCAAHPDGIPSCVVTRGASPWTLGHEIGHVLDLNHVNDNDRLMTGNGTANITNPPPDLVSSEVDTMHGSTFVDH